jgi:glycosyltransferase involved in cell wall biosynthesis
MNNPLVSVIIPLYNHENYIGEAIDSVLRQAYQNLELIIINDGSTDKSEIAARQHNDPRIRYLAQENQGAHATINRGITLAKGEFIAILNSDDFYHPERIQKFIESFKHNPDLMAGFSSVNLIRNGRLILSTGGSNYIWENAPEINNYRDDQDFLLDLLHGNFLATTSNLFCRREMFDEIGLFRNYRYAHDYDLFLKMGLKYRSRIMFLEEPMVTYRYHGKNTIHENFLRPIYETCIVLARFLNSASFEDIIQKEKVELNDIEKFFNSIVTMDAPKILMAFIATTRNWEEHDFEAAANDVDSDLFHTMISYKQFKPSLEPDAQPEMNTEK